MPADRKPRDQDADQDLLKEIRDRYRYYDQAWKEIREHSRKCRKYLNGDPWEKEDRQNRKNNGRPCINHDELNQYINQATGNLRQNKRAIKINPEGNGSDAKTAEFRQNQIRGIEYRCHAQNAYITAYEQMLEGSYGWFRIGRRYVNRRKNKDQEITISAIPNPDSVLYDPDCKQPDWSDARGCFVLEPIPIPEFKRRFPEAQIKDFSAEHLRIAKDWLQKEMVLTAEYWRVIGDEEDGLTVEQYLTNGIEILDELPQPGEHIAIIPVIGKQRYIDEGGTAKRTISALVSQALEPQLSLAFLCSQEMEEAGLSPKVPYVGYKGQFESDATAWENLNQVPRSFVQADPITDASDGKILPLPRREQFVPNFQAYEMAKDSCRRAIQAGIGISPLPTAAQRNNEKSGVALERIESQEALGSFHFTDNFDRALEFAGRVILSWIPVVYDTEREIALRMPDDKHRIVRINTKEPYLDETTKEMVHYKISEQDGDHGPEVSTGPSYQSQREDAADFLDKLIANLQALPIPPPQAAKLLALAIQMRQLGPKGDEMAEIISPSQDTPMSPQAMAQLQAASANAQQQAALIQELQAEIIKLQHEKNAKIIDNEYKLQLENMRRETQLAVAEISTKAQELSERVRFVEDVWQKLNVEQPHEQALAAAGQAHEQQMASQQQDADRQAAADAAAQQPAAGEAQPQA